MSDFALDGLDRSRLDWPEPLLIDLIGEGYGDAAGRGDRIEAARLHVRFLHELVDGQPRTAAFLRLELIATCAARGIAIAAIENGDAAAFAELKAVVEARFRNCDRMRDHFRQRLEDAARRLPARTEPRREPAKVSWLAERRRVPERPVLTLRERLAAYG